MAREGLSTSGTAASYRRWLDDAEANARNTFLREWNPAWDDISPSVDVDTAVQYFQDGELDLLTEKAEYDRCLGQLDAWFPGRKEFWMKRYARTATVSAGTGTPHADHMQESRPAPTIEQVAKRKAALKAFRNKEGISAVELARRLGVDDSVVRGVTRGDFSRGGHGLDEKILKLAGISVAVWFS